MVLCLSLLFVWYKRDVIGDNEDIIAVFDVSYSSDPAFFTTALLPTAYPPLPQLPPPGRGFTKLSFDPHNAPPPPSVSTESLMLFVRF